MELGVEWSDFEPQSPSETDDDDQTIPGVVSDHDSCDARVVPIDSVSLRNILKPPAITVHEVEQLLPDLMMNEGWGTVQKSLAKTIAVTRCIDGDSLRIDCKAHSRGHHLKCKCHIDIRPYRGATYDFAGANAVVLKLAIAGTCLSAKEHMDAARDVQNDWKRR